VCAVRGDAEEVAMLTELLKDANAVEWVMDFARMTQVWSKWRNMLPSGSWITLPIQVRNRHRRDCMRPSAKKE
jgi:hypothetical protein